MMIQGEKHMVNKYINNLKKFVGNDFSYTLNDDVIRVRSDWQTLYEYDINNRKISIIERASRSEIQRFKEDKFLKMEFAIILSGVFDKTMDYDIVNIFAEKNNLVEVKEEAKQYLDEKYYSIGIIEENKMSLILDGNYKIIFRYKNVDYLVKDDSDKKVVFRIFYRKVEYMSFFERAIKRYMHIFDETFTKDELVRFWGYPIGIR